MSALASLRDALIAVLDDTAPDTGSSRTVQYRQVANRLVNEAISGTNPVAAIQTIVSILEVQGSD